jgi:hypothetical protein
MTVEELRMTAEEPHMMEEGLRSQAAELRKLVAAVAFDLAQDSDS